MPQVEFPAITHIFLFQMVNCFLSTVWPILIIQTFGIIIANKTILTKFVFLKYKRFDVSKIFEQFSNIFISHLSWQIFNIDVVNEFSDVSSLAWLKLNSCRLFI
jgi:hypothetical protein